MDKEHETVTGRDEDKARGAGEAEHWDNVNEGNKSDYSQAAGRSEAGNITTDSDDAVNFDLLRTLCRGRRHRNHSSSSSGCSFGDSWSSGCWWSAWHSPSPSLQWLRRLAAILSAATQCTGWRSHYGALEPNPGCPREGAGVLNTGSDLRPNPPRTTKTQPPSYLPSSGS